MRGPAFACGFYAVTILLAILYLPLLAAPDRTFRPFGVFWLRVSLWLCQAVGGVRARWLHRERIPPGPVIFAAKHQSAWETLALAAEFDMPAFVLKQELTRIPFFGWYLAKTRHIAVDRGAGARALRRMTEQAAERLAEGRSVVIFPQGTRTPPGTARPYLPGVAALYAAANVPVVPVALDSGRVWPRSMAALRPGLITVEFLEPIEPGLPKRIFMETLENRIESAVGRLESGDSEGGYAERTCA